MPEMMKQEESDSPAIIRSARRPTQTEDIEDVPQKKFRFDLKFNSEFMDRVVNEARIAVLKREKQSQVEEPSSSVDVEHSLCATQIIPVKPKRSWTLGMVVEGKAEEVILLDRLPVCIGRDDKKCVVCVEGVLYKHVSRVHAEIGDSDDLEHIYLKDLSSNGTFLNGSLIGLGSCRFLRHGDEFCLGDLSHLEDTTQNRECRFKVYGPNEGPVTDCGSSRRFSDTTDGHSNLKNSETVEPKRLPVAVKEEVACNKAGPLDDQTILISDSDEDPVPDSIAPVKIELPSSTSDDVIHISDDEEEGELDFVSSQAWEQIKQEPIVFDEGNATPTSVGSLIREVNETTSCEVTSASPSIIPQVVLPKKPEKRISDKDFQNAHPPKVVSTKEKILSRKNPSVKSLVCSTSSTKSTGDVIPATSASRSPSMLTPPIAFSLPHSTGEPTFRPYELNVNVPPVSCAGNSEAPHTMKNAEPISTTFIEPRKSNCNQKGSAATNSVSTFKGFVLSLNPMLFSRKREKDQPFLTQILHQSARSFLASANGTVRKFTNQEYVRHWYCYLCLETAQKVSVTWRNARQQKRKGALVSQALLPKAGTQVTRMSLVLSSNDGTYTPYKEWSVVSIQCTMVRQGGQQHRRKEMLGVVEAVKRRDRRQRSGGVAVPDCLRDVETKLNILDEVEILVNSSLFEGYVVQTQLFVECCDITVIKEFHKIRSLNTIPTSYRELLLNPSPANIWSAKGNLKNCDPEQIARVTLSALSSPQSEVVCSALALAMSPEQSVKVMVVDGAAGTGKTKTLIQTAIEAALAKPNETVLALAKCHRSADDLMLQLAEYIAKSVRLCKLKLTRVGHSNAPEIARFTVMAQMASRRKGELQRDVDKTRSQIAEVQRKIADAEKSLEDQLTELTTSLKNRKLAEIAQLNKDSERLDSALRKLEMEQAGGGGSVKWKPDVDTKMTSYRKIVEVSNIITCTCSDIEIYLSPNTFAGGSGKRISLILIDQAHQCLASDLLGLYQLQCSKIVMFGDQQQCQMLQCFIRSPENRSHDWQNGTEFKRMIATSPSSVYHLTSQFRVLPPLSGLVNSMFYSDTLKHSVQSRPQETGLTPLFPITVIDVCSIDFEVADLHEDALIVLKLVLTAITSVADKVFVCETFHDHRRQFEHVRRGLIGKVGFCRPEYFDSTTIDVLVVPVFNEKFMAELSNDQGLLCTLLTRARRAVIFLGVLTQMSESKHMKTFLDKVKLLNRFFQEKPAWFQRNANNTHDIIGLLQ